MKKKIAAYLSSLINEDAIRLGHEDPGYAYPTVGEEEVDDDFVMESLVGLSKPCPWYFAGVQTGFILTGTDGKMYKVTIEEQPAVPIPMPEMTVEEILRREG